MLARLWWKDARQFWPIWLIVAGSAAACQWFLLAFGGQDVRQGWLIVAAVGWSLLYGFAVSAAAFAGERENNTLAFLDMIPVGRRVLWSGKASFALVSTMVLALVLAAMGWRWSDRLMSTDVLNAPTGLTLALVALSAALILIEVLGWGLFWSAVSGNAMVAAVLAMVCLGLGVSLTEGVWISTGAGPRAGAFLRLALAIAAAGASVVAITLGERPRRSPSALLDDSIRIETRRGRIRIRPRVFSTTVRALIWETSREVWPIWWRIVALGFGLPLLCLVVGLGAIPALVVILNEMLLIVAGVSVFGAENRGRTQRFLAHHGARPGVVWAVKLAIWMVWLTPVWILMIFLAASFPNMQGGQELSAYALIALTGVAVGQLTGMLIRRGITAGLVAIIGVVAVGLPQVALLSWQMLPWQVTLAAPLVLLAVSWAWSADWMLERPGLGRWARLAALLVLAVATVLGVHVASRVYAIPDIGPGFDVAAFERAAAVAPGDNAADLYNDASRRLVRLGPVVLDRLFNEGIEGEAHGEDSRVWRRDEAEIREILGRASLRPRCQFVRLDKVNDLSVNQTVYPGLLSQFMLSLARQHREKGNLAGAWDDLMVLFRMARHQTGPVSAREATIVLRAIEGPALGEAMQWAADRRQTPEQLRAASDAYRALPPMPPIIETVRAQSILVENTLNLPSDVLIGALVQSDSHLTANEYEKTSAALHAAVTTSPWERARARRAYRIYSAFQARDLESNPKRVAPAMQFVYEQIQDSRIFLPQGRSYSDQFLREFTPLSRYLFHAPLDDLIALDLRNETYRRALVQILALRQWQIHHGGKLPDSLNALVESHLLPSLPADPYFEAAHRAFGYVRSSGQSLLPIGELGALWAPIEQKTLVRTENARLLYSFGPDRWDNQALKNYERSTGSGDLIFPLADDLK